MTTAGAIALVSFLVLCFILVAPFAMAETSRRAINEWQDEEDGRDSWSGDVADWGGERPRFPDVLTTIRHGAGDY